MAPTSRLASPPGGGGGGKGGLQARWGQTEDQVLMEESEGEG